MITLESYAALEEGYRRWLKISPTPFWALIHTTFTYKHTHVQTFEDFKLTMENETLPFPEVTVPVPQTYPIGKMHAGLISTKNTMAIILRNMPRKDFTIQDFLITYIKKHWPDVELSKGFSHNQNDVIVNGRKVLGQIQFKRGGHIYYGCFIQLDFTNEDKNLIAEGMKDDRNFYPDKIENITGLKVAIPDFNIHSFIEELEDVFAQSNLEEYSNG
jgi:hypothetical protein